MKKYLDMVWSSFIVPLKDFRFLGWMCIVCFFAHQIDEQGLLNVAVILYVFMFFLFSLFVRKIFFPYRTEKEDGSKEYLKLSDFFKEALEGNLAAAVMGSTLIFFMLGVAYLCVYWIRG